MSARPSSALSRPPAAILLGAALLAVVVGALVTGAADAPAVADPGAFSRWGVLVTRAVSDLAAATTVGLLVLAAFLAPETTRTHRRVNATRLAAQSAALWVVSAALGLVLSFASLAGVPVSDPSFGTQLTANVWDLEVTRVSLISLLMAAFVAVAAAVTTSRAVMAWLAAMALAALLPLALTGHTAGSADHETAVNALALHLVGAIVWVGGLLALALMRGQLGTDLPPTVARYSTLAGWAFTAVLLSGLQSAWLRLGGLAGLASAYGALVLVKATALVVLGLLGWQQRRSVIRRMATQPSAVAHFVRLLLTELLVMGIAFGTAVALARSAPPVPEALVGDVTPAQVLTGFPAPDEALRGMLWLTTWRISWLWLGLGVLAVALYLVGVRRLARRGDRWPVGRTIVWVLGWALFVYATCGAPGVYGRFTFSQHMVMHMVVAMMVPILLVPAAPITLALRALPTRQDKTWGPRELLLAVVHSRVLGWFANPVVAAALFFFSLTVFYYSPLFEVALTTHTGHIAMMLHFLLTGYLFVWVLIGIDPGPKRWSPPFLLVILFATISFHAFFGVAITGSTTLLAPDFFGALRLPWVTDPLGDQHTGGAIAWGIGEAPTLALAMLVTLGWVRSDRLETRRLDRQADRDGDAELAAYNAQLAQRRQQHERAEQARTEGARTEGARTEGARTEGARTERSGRAGNHPAQPSDKGE